MSDTAACDGCTQGLREDGTACPVCRGTGRLDVSLEAQRREKAELERTKGRKP